MKRAFVAALLVAPLVTSCEKKEPPPPAATPPSASVVASVAPSASMVPPAQTAQPVGPTYLRLPVAVTSTRDAFDGDPFTIVGTKGPIEGKLAKKRKIKRVRVVGTDVKTITVSFDGGAAVTRESGDVDVDLDAQSVKVTVAEGTVAEVELYGELPIGIAEAPEDLAQRVKELEGKPSPAPLLGSLGITGAKPGLVTSARSFRAQLDRDSDQEGLVVIAQAARTYVVFVDDDAHGRAVVGAREVASCDGGAQVKPQPVHAESFSDVVITWKSCGQSDPGGMVVTLDRGMAETVWSFRSKQELHFGGAFPKTIEMLDGAKVAERHTFDPVAFRYR
ncbi:MAG: hypothetical protein ACXWUG_15120 [Polyangiales bacterium]